MKKYWNWVAWTLAAACFLIVGLLQGSGIVEGDTFWSARAGDQILAQHTVFLHDTYSWIVPGKAWHPNSWLYDVFLSLASRGGGVGLGLLTAAGALLVGGIFLVAARSLKASALGALTLSVLGIPLFISWFNARAQTLTDGFMVLVIFLSVKALTAEKAGRRLLLVGGVFILWANIHLAAITGVAALGGGVGVAFLVSKKRRELVRRGVALGAIGVVACLCTPLGVDIFSSALSTRNASSGQIVEWKALWQTNGLGIAAWSAALLMSSLLFLQWQKRRDVPTSMWLGGAVILMVLGISAARFSPMALMVALPGAASWLSETRWLKKSLQIGGVVLLAIWLDFASLVLGKTSHLGAANPVAIVSKQLVMQIPAGCKVENEYNDGGYIIYLRSADQVKVSMDGRNDMYGRALVKENLRELKGEAGALSKLESEGVGCILADTKRDLVTQALASGHWREVGRDTKGVLLVRAA